MTFSHLGSNAGPARAPVSVGRSGGCGGRIVGRAETVRNRLPLTLSAGRPQTFPKSPRAAAGVAAEAPAASACVSSQGLAVAPARLLPPFSLQCFSTVTDFLGPRVRPCHPLPEDLSLGCPLSRKQTLSPQWDGGRGGMGSPRSSCWSPSFPVLGSTARPPPSPRRHLPRAVPFPCAVCPRTAAVLSRIHHLHPDSALHCSKSFKLVLWFDPQVRVSSC